jgi:hypothetical protein
MTEQEEISYIDKHKSINYLVIDFGVISLQDFIDKVLDLGTEQDLSKIMIRFDAGYETVTLDTIKEKSQKELDQEIEAIKLKYRKEEEKKENAKKARQKIKQLEEEIWQLKMKL